MHTLVISPGSAEKRASVPGAATAEELADAGLRSQAELRLAAFSCPAIAMYTGAHHRLVSEAVRSVWERWGKATLELALLSPGYGLLRADQMIVPYEASFGPAEAAEPAARLIRQQIADQATALVSGYDLAFYLLNGSALQALGLPLDVPAGTQQIVLTDETSLPRIPSLPNLHALVAAQGRAARRWHVKAPQVCGFLFGRLCEQIARNGPAVLEWLHDQPQDLEHLFYKRAQWRPQLALWSGAG